MIKYFEEKYYKNVGNGKRYRLAMNMKPFVTIFGLKKVNNKNSEINNVTSPICIPWRTRRKHLYQEDQYESFISKDSFKSLHIWMKFLRSVGILLERMITMSYFTSQKKTKCQYLKWQTVSELTQNYMSILFSKGGLSHYPNGFAKRLSFVSQKYVKRCSCLFTVTQIIAFLCIWRNTRT